MRLIAAAVSLLLITGCQKAESPASQQAEAPIKQAPPALSADQKREMIAKITDRSDSVKVDKFKGTTFWTSSPGFDSNPVIYFYVSDPKDRPELTFRVVYTYIGSDWVFFNRIQILADDEKVIDIQLPREKEPSRDVVAAKVIESVDIELSEAHAKAFDKVAGSKTAIIRYSGKGEVDININEREKRNFAKMVEMYDDSRIVDGLQPLGLTRRSSGDDNLWKVYVSTDSKKNLEQLKQKAKELGLELKIDNLATIAWFVSGTPRSGYAAAEADRNKSVAAASPDPRTLPRLISMVSSRESIQ